MAQFPWDTPAAQRKTINRIWTGTIAYSGSTEAIISDHQRRGVGKTLDVIFPLVHGKFGEDGSLQGLLELADLPYIGPGVLGSAVGMDKVIQKELLIRADIQRHRASGLRLKSTARERKK